MGELKMSYCLEVIVVDDDDDDVVADDVVGEDDDGQWDCYCLLKLTWL